MQRSATIFAVFAMLGALVACGGEGVPGVVVTERPADDVGYQPGETDTVVSGDREFVVEGELGTDCVKIGDDCVDIAALKLERCGDANAQADLVVVDGQVVDVICYPPKSAGVPLEEAAVTQDGTVEVPQNNNGAVVIFPPATDGLVVEGDVSLQGERIAIIGNGVDKTTIGGNLIMGTNNAQVRGLTIEGNLVVQKNTNNITIAFVRVKGNLVIEGNSALVIRADVYGNLQVQGNSASLHNIDIGGELSISGSTEICTELFSFADANNDFVITADELGTELTCAQ
jgi:hypothetical protein